MLKRFRWWLLALALTANLAYAWIGFLAPLSSGVIWLGRIAGANVTMARAVEWSILVQGALITFLNWRNPTETSTTTPSGHLEVSFDHTAARDNPDPAKFDNATAGSIDPQPKASIAQATSQGTQSAPSTAQAVVADMGFVAGSKWYKKDATSDILYTVQVTTACPTGTNSGAVLSGSTYVGCVPSSSSPVTTYAAMVAEMGVPGAKCYVYNASTDTCYKTQAVTTCTGYTSLAPAGYQGAVCTNWATIANSYAYNGTAAVFVKSQAPAGFLVFSQTASFSCDPGYVSNGAGACQLADVTKVMKPVTTPCQLRPKPDGTWDFDAKNPVCNTLQGIGRLSCTGATCTYVRGVGDYDSVTKNPDGTGLVSTRGPAGNRDITVGAPASDGTPIKGITDIPSSGTAPGGGTNTGSSGSGCGGAGQVACSVTSADDGGWTGKEGLVRGAGTTAGTGLDAGITAADAEKADKGNDFGVNNSWIPSLKPHGTDVACRPLPMDLTHYNFILGRTVTIDPEGGIDWCHGLDLMREIMTWLFGAGAVAAIALIFFTSNKGTSR